MWMVSTFGRVEFHLPAFLPLLQFYKVLLQNVCILDSADLAVQQAVICEEVSVCLFVLRFYGPVNPVGSCRARSVYLTTHLLNRLSPLSS